MATEGTYKELSAGYEYTKTVNGITATRQFIDSYPGATDSLPEMGDPLDSADEIKKTVVVISIRETYYGNDCTQKLYVISYSNTPGTSDNPDNPNNSDPDELPISGGLSAESISIDAEKTENKDKWVWVGTETPCNQQLFKTIVTGTFKVTRRLANLELDKWAEYCGVINTGAFKAGGSTFAVGLVMFNGVEYDEYRNSKGERRYRVTFSFTVKKMREFAGATYVGWNYMFDPTDGTFKVVVGSDSNEPLYEEANLGLLLAGTEEP
jgi:hypothetical protein